MGSKTTLRRRAQHFAWAIVRKEDDAILGRYYFKPFCVSNPQHEGGETALFRTRAAAQKLIKEQAWYYPLRIIRVRVTIDELKRKRNP